MGRMDNRFRGKKITVMGLGLLGGAVNDVKFLADCGADLIVTDIKTEGELAPSIQELSNYKGIKYVFGGHKLEDFRGRDYILQPGNVPINSPYLAEAKKNNIPVLESEALFMLFAPKVMTIGVTGTRGKSTVTQLIYEILSARLRQGYGEAKRVLLGGNVKGVSTLSLLDDVHDDDVVVMELDSWSLNGLGQVKMSPRIAVFTNFMDDHMNFYKSKDDYFADKANIYRFQGKGDYLVTNNATKKLIEGKEFPVSGQIIEIAEGTLDKDWKINLLGDHNHENVAYAVAVARLLGVEDEIIKNVVADFSGLPGRLEFRREVGGVKYVNDTNGTTPDAVVAALKALGDEKKKNIILICGGVSKVADYKEMAREISRYCRAVILFDGSAAIKLNQELRIENYEEDSCQVIYNSILPMHEAVLAAKERSAEGDIILLSPGAASFGMFKNEFDRGEQFNNEVAKLK